MQKTDCWKGTQTLVAAVIRVVIVKEYFILCDIYITLAIHGHTVGLFLAFSGEGPPDALTRMYTCFVALSR